MAYKLIRSVQCDADLELIFDHLVESYQSFGETVEDAYSAAGRRLLDIEDFFEKIATTPHQGTLRPDLIPGLRHVTKDRTIIYFTVDDESQTVRLLSVFFGGQDHQRTMLKRLLEISDQ